MKMKIYDLKTTDHVVLKSSRTISELNPFEKGLADIAIAPAQKGVYSGVTFMDKKALYGAIDNADEIIKFEIMDVLVADEEVYKRLEALFIVKDEEDETTDDINVEDEVEDEVITDPVVISVTKEEIVTEEVKDETPNKEEEVIVEEPEEVIEKVAVEEPIEVVIEEEVVEPEVEVVEEVVVVEKEEYELTEKEQLLLDYDISQLKDATKNYITRYWNGLTKLYDNLEIDYSEIKLKDYTALRALYIVGE